VLLSTIGCQRKVIFEKKKEQGKTEESFFITSNRKENVLLHLVTKEESVLQDSTITYDHLSDKKFNTEKDWVKLTFNEKRVKVKGNKDMEIPSSKIDLSEIKETHIVSMLDSLWIEAEKRFYKIVNF